MFLFFIVGLVFFAIGIFILIADFQFKKKAIKTSGRVVGFESYESRSKNSGKTMMYTPVIEYEHGQTYRFISKVSSSSMGYEIDQEVELMFDPDNPEDARMDRPANKYMGIFIALFGAVFMGVYVANFSTDKHSLIFEGVTLGMVLIAALFKFIRKKNMTPEQKAAEAKRKAEFKARRRQGRASTNKQDESLDLFDSDSHLAVKGYQPSEKMIRDSSQVTQIKEKQKMPYWAKVLGLLIGLGALGGGGYWAKSQYDFIQSAEQSSGKVVKFETRRGKKGKTMYAPVVEFTDNQGQSHKFKSKTSSSHKSYNRGEQVQVYYNGQNPADAMINKGWFNWLFPGIIFFVGLIISLISFKSLSSASKPREL